MPPDLSCRFVLFPEQNRVEMRDETLSNAPLAPLEAVLRTEVSIISAGTELATLANTLGDVRYPLQPGYGCIGRIEAKGEDVTDFAVGQRVLYAGKHASRQRFRHRQGHQWGTLYPAPESIAPETAVFATLAQIASVAPLVTPLKIGDTVAVFGLGLVGNLAAQVYQLSGARVIAFDPQAARCNLARQVGLDAHDVPPSEQVTTLHELTNGRGADVTVEATGLSAAFGTCVAGTARFGQVALLGTPRASFTSDITPALHRIHEQGLTVRGAHMWRLPPLDTPETTDSVAGAFRRVFSLIESGALKVDALRSHVIRPDAIPETYFALRDHPGDFAGVVIDWR